MNRAAITAALEAKLAALPGFVTKGGRWQAIEQLQETQFPAWFLVKDREEQISVGRTTAIGGTVWKLFYEVHLYGFVPEGMSAVAVVDPLVDAVVDDMDPGALDHQTLGNVVTECRVGDSIDYDGGLFGDKTWAAVPLVLLSA